MTANRFSDRTTKWVHDRVVGGTPADEGFEGKARIIYDSYWGLDRSLLSTSWLVVVWR